jgi:hypothetical protein
MVHKWEGIADLRPGSSRARKSKANPNSRTVTTKGALQVAVERGIKPPAPALAHAS